MVFALPFERLPSKDIFGITIRASLIIGALIIVRVVYLLWTKRLKFKWNWLYMLLAIFVGWVFLIVPESINIKRGFLIATFDSFVIALCVAVSLIYKKEYLNKLIAILLASAVIVSIFAIYQFIGDMVGLPGYLTGMRDRYSMSLFGFPRVQATALEPLYFGSYLLLPTMVTLGMFVTNYYKLVSRRVLMGLIVLFTMVIFLTVARGAILGLIVGFIVITIVALVNKRTTLKNLAISLVLLIAGFVLSYLAINYFSKLPDDIRKTQGKRGGSAFTQQITNTGLEGSGDERAMAREKALKILSENRSSYILGIGPGQYGPYVTNNQPEFYGWPIVNNLTLELLVETGLVGLGLIVAFFIGLIIKSYRSTATQASRFEIDSVLALGLIAYLASQAMQFQTFSSLYVMHIWVPAGFLMGMIGSAGLYKK